MMATERDGITYDLLSALTNSPSIFLQPPLGLSSSAISTAKQFLDPLAEDIATAQKSRRDENRKKRKRGQAEPEEQVLQLRKVYTNGLGVKQVWEQARRILDAAQSEIERSSENFVDSKQTSGSANGFLPLGVDEEPSAPEDESGSDDIDDQNGLSGDEDMSEGDYEDEEGVEDELQDESVQDLLEKENIEAESDEVLSDDLAAPQETYAPDPNGLNDGFFSIDDFNKQSQFLEQQDARGDDDNPSDEDEIDWDADPLAQTIPKLTQTGRKDNESGESDEEGPTFGNADLDADSDEDMDGEGVDLDEAMPGLNNTNDIRYADFFQPPPKKLSKTKRMRALPKTQPPKESTARPQEDLDADTQRAVDDVNRDLFDSEEEFSADESGSDVDLSRNKNLSTHEKQQAKIAAEIRRLEAVNVAKRDWTLSGEARAVDRPMNSLLEEDMEFERVGKPVPVVTAETSEEIEQLIKRRIIAREFDEIVRRHPDSIGVTAETRRGRVEVDDSKPQTSLGEIYEQEHLKSTDPGYVDKRSAATKKQHEEIERLWKDVSGQLDLLSNLHFKPKRADIQIKTVSDKPTIAMEDARPLGAGGEDSMLAPQEVYRAGENGKVAGEVTRKSGTTVNKEEMTREEKVRKRRREKERNKKAGVNQPPKPSSDKSAAKIGEKKDKKQDKQDILTDLRKGNVKVIDKKGGLQDLGKQKKAHGDGVQSGSALKL